MALTGSSDLQGALARAGGEFPYRVEVSVRPLIEFWTETLARDGAVKGAIGRSMREALERTPELWEPFDDRSVVTRHRELLDVLMSVVFPSVFWEQEFGAALMPFRLRAFYATPSAERLLMGADGTLEGRVNVDAGTVGAVRLLHAGRLILQRLYGLHLEVDYPLIFTVADADTGLERHFKMHFDYRFLDVEPVGDLPPLPDEARRALGDLVADPARLLTLFPPEAFVFRGFTVFRAVDVTDQEVLSSLKRDLIDKESIVSNARFEGLQAKLRTLFRRPDLRLALAAMDGDRVLMLNYGARLEHACIFADSAHLRVSDFAGSIYEQAVQLGRPLIVEDLAAHPRRCPMEDDLLRTGARNLVVAPLHYQDKLIGMLELGSPRPADLNAAHLPKLQEVLPLFSMAVQRSLEELEARIQAFIKEKCTAIHPTVEWRFRKAVLDGLERQEAGDAGLAEIEPIVFEGVYPLYGLSDIRGSSTQRALAIQADLATQLRLARDVLQAARRTRALPILGHLTYRVDRCLGDIETSLRSGDEVGAVAFLQDTIEPLFDRVRAFGPEVVGAIEAYRAALDPRLGAVYRRRRDFDESVARVNDTISSYLDLEEQAAQSWWPHYFEKQKTDGVDYGIYVGASLTEHGGFDPLYVKNLRLWQLMITCGIATRAERLRGRLAVPLETTHLLLAQDNPLSIRFRFDEKRFDVDGAYNARYEIVKKRIDKATVRGSGERLTQPGRIAIVYAQPREAAEYREYIGYLRHLRYLLPAVEDLELEELQGVQGLRALRVTVDLDNAPADRPVPAVEVERGVAGAASG